VNIYRSRPEIRAIIHSHPPTITAFSCTDQEINFNITEDQTYYIGDIEWIPFTLCSEKLMDVALSKLQQSNALILKNHGIYVLGDSLSEAVTITELLEHHSRIYMYARLAGQGEVIELPREYWTQRETTEPRTGLIYHDEIFD
jgi:L-fuculose-phosphate aldolase